LHAHASLGIATTLLILVGGCASTQRAGSGSSSVAAGSSAAPTTQERALARYSAYAGPPLPSFTWLGHFYSWEALGQDRLVVYTTPGEAYLLRVAPPCDLRFVIYRVGLTSTASTVHTGLDSVVVDNAAAGAPWQCPIEEIRQVDVRRMQAEMRSQQQPPPPQR
jgi:hypothetical protein